MKIEIVRGSFAQAVVYTVDDPSSAFDEYARAQVKMICDHRASEGSVIRVMPDVHPGKVGPIGLTMSFEKYILPQLVGIDIGCGMTIARLRKPQLEFQKLDSVIRDHVPSGFHLHSSPKADFDFDALQCADHIRQNNALCSLGTLGGGNHFIELDRNQSGEIYIIIHSGSRHLGKEIADFYCREGQKQLRNDGIAEPYETTWLYGDLMENYIHDVEITQRFANLNRETILKTILKKMKWKLADEPVSCCHNYIECNSNARILRKGAVAAHSGDTVIIPINMRDGVILAKGLGNPDWNQSAPHGSGRLYKREDVQRLFSVSAYKKSMEGIFSTSVARSTLDESPFCYRKLEDIQNVIGDTVKIEQILKPLYNFKDCQEG